MPILYDISPEINLLIYICTETLNGVKFFETADKAVQDPYYRPQMKMIIDISTAEIDTSVSDMRLAIEKNKILMAGGQKLGLVAVYTQSTSLKFLADALKIMSPDAPSTFSLCSNKRDAISWLGLSELEKEVVQFWDAASAKASKAE